MTTTHQDPIVPKVTGVPTGSLSAVATPL